MRVLAINSSFQANGTTTRLTERALEGAAAQGADLALFPEMWNVGYTSSLPPGEGLLFIFPEADERAFWMENTRVVRGLVFIGADRRIVSVKPGRTFDRASILSDGPAQYVLEVNAAESRGLAPGDRVVFAP